MCLFHLQKEIHSYCTLVLQFLVLSLMFNASGLSLNNRLSVMTHGCHITHEQSCRIYFFIWAAHDVT